MEPPPNMEAIRVVNVCGNILSAPGVPGVVLRVAARTMFSQWTVNIRLSRDHRLCMVVEMPRAYLLTKTTTHEIKTCVLIVAHGPAVS